MGVEAPAEVAPENLELEEPKSLKSENRVEEEEEEEHEEEEREGREEEEGATVAPPHLEAPHESPKVSSILSKI